MDCRVEKCRVDSPGGQNQHKASRLRKSTQTVGDEGAGGGTRPG